MTSIGKQKDRAIEKPLGRKAYGSIPHLPGSRLGKGDHFISPGQDRILTERCRKGDTVIVQDKLDGSNVAVAKLQDCRLVALGRSGYLAESSPFLQHQLFSDWVYSQYDRFYCLLQPGEWVSGEWLAQAHGTRYKINAEPFVAFDLFSKGKRILSSELKSRCIEVKINLPLEVHAHSEALSVEDAMKKLNVMTDAFYVPLDPREGAVWRCENERNGVEFLAKYVRHDKVDGKYFSEISGMPPHWNEGLMDFLPPKAIKRLRGSL